MSWIEVFSDVLMWRDSCNVYAVLAEDCALIIDAGSGDWLKRGAAQLPVPPKALAVTHYFRDHSAGAAAAARSGIAVYVPEGEQHIFRDPLEHFRRRETYILYDNIWDLYAPAEAVSISGVLRDYEHITLAGIEVQVLPLPGATPTQTGLLVKTPRSGHLVAFSAETIHSPGRVPRAAPLQYDYADLLGAVNVAFSADLLRKHVPDAILPSLGEPIVELPGQALAKLHEGLVSFTSDRANEGIGVRAVGKDTVEKLSDHVWRSTQAMAASHFIVGDKGRALIIDYGYWHASGPGEIEPGVAPPFLLPAYPFPERRRPLLHSLDALRDRAGIEEFDAVIPTHYHDDHVCGIPLLQRMLNLKCWAPANFSALLANPQAYRFPCTWPQPINIERELALDEPFEWDGIHFHFGAMSGHTRFSSLIGWEVDGVRFVHAGDQYRIVDSNLQPREWPVPGIVPNYVYRNGAFKDAYQRSAEWIVNFHPDIVLSGHWQAVKTDDAYFEQLVDCGQAFANRHQSVMALADTDPHFGLDSMPGWMRPYRVYCPDIEPIHFEVTVRNPLAVEATLELELAGPSGWTGSSAVVRAGARAEVTATMSIVPSSSCRRQPVTVELRANGRPFGQVLEALVSVGGDAF